MSDQQKKNLMTMRALADSFQARDERIIKNMGRLLAKSQLSETSQKMILDYIKRLHGTIAGYQEQSIALLQGLVNDDDVPEF